MFMNKDHNTPHQKTTRVCNENLPIRTKTKHIHRNVEQKCSRTESPKITKIHVK